MVLERLPGIRLEIPSHPPAEAIQMLEAARPIGWEYQGARDSGLSGRTFWWIEWRVIEGSGKRVPRECLAQIIFEGDAPDLRVEIRAPFWDPDPATYDTYVAAAHEFLKRLSDAVQFQVVARIQSRDELAPKLTETSAEIWKSFTGLANWSLLHPLDEERFHDFIIETHNNEEEVGFEDIEILLGDTPCSDELAYKLAARYTDGRALLRRYKERRSH